MRRRFAVILSLVLCMVGMLSFPVSAADSDFDIVDGILVEYLGKGGDVVIPEGVVEIVEACFFDNKDITSVKIPEGCTTLGYQVFEGCENLESVWLPDSLVNISNSMFRKCDKLKTVRLPKGLKYMPADFLQGPALEQFDIPDTITYIDHWTLCGISWTSATLPESCTRIGDGVFGYLSSKTFELTVLNPEMEFSKAALEGDENVDVTIKGYTGSTAEAFAKEHNFKFVALDGGAAEKPAEPAPEKKAEPATAPASNPKTGDVGVAPYILLAAASGVAMLKKLKK